MKTISIDWDNYEEVKKLFNQVKSRKLQLEPGRVSKADKQSAIFNACWDVFNTDISHLYDDTISDDSYYVYAHCDTTNTNDVGRSGTAAFAASLGMKYYPFYIGKGVGNRAYDLNRNETHRKVRQKLHHFGKEIDVVIIKNNLTNNEALQLESKLIDIFGLLSKGGKLCNLDEGKDNKARINQYKDKLSIINKFHTF